MRLERWAGTNTCGGLGSFGRKSASVPAVMEAPDESQERSDGIRCEKDGLEDTG